MRPRRLGLLRRPHAHGNLIDRELRARARRHGAYSPAACQVSAPGSRAPRRTHPPRPRPQRRQLLADRRRERARDRVGIETARLTTAAPGSWRGATMLAMGSSHLGAVLLLAALAPAQRTWIVNK